MGYKGTTVNIPLGEMGLYTDDAQTITPPQGLLLGENIQVQDGYIEKQPGSRKWNLNALPSPIVQIFDWWPDENNQRVIAVTQDGRVWRFTNPYNYSEVTPVGAAPTVLKVTIPPFIVSCGQEEAGNPRKLFIMTGNDPIQVISGDGITRHNIALPALDWSLNHQPYFGIVFLNRLWAFGNSNFPHLLYASNVENHEDFQTNGSVLFVNVFPGDSERLISGYNFKGRLMLFKYPKGYYFIDTSDPTAPIPQKLGNSFGASSQGSILNVLDDLWIGNSTGTITSLTATNALGGLQQTDIIKSLKSYRYISEFTAPLKGFDQKAIWYEAKKMAMFSYHSPSGMHIDRIFVIDFQSGKPRCTFVNKDIPSCLGLIKDYQLVERPFYGSVDGFIYQMDQEDRNVGGNGENNSGGHGYTMNFQIPYLDFYFLDRSIAEINKNFDFLELSFEPTGNWSLLADVYLDNVFSETVSFDLSQSDILDKNFRLDRSRLSGPGPRSVRRPIHGQGRRISVRFYQSGYNQNVKIAAVTFYFRTSAQQQRSS